MTKEDKQLNIKLESIDGQPYININSKKFNLTIGCSMHLALEELRSLNTGLEIKFENFAQLGQLIHRINNLNDFSNNKQSICIL